MLFHLLLPWLTSSPANTFVHLKAKIPAKVTQNAASFLHKFLFWKPGFTSELTEGHFSWLLWQYLRLKEIRTKLREGRNKSGPIKVMVSKSENWEESGAVSLWMQNKAAQVFLSLVHETMSSNSSGCRLGCF